MSLIAEANYICLEFVFSPMGMHIGTLAPSMYATHPNQLLVREPSTYIKNFNVCAYLLITLFLQYFKKINHLVLVYLMLSCFSMPL